MITPHGGKLKVRHSYAGATNNCLWYPHHRPTYMFALPIGHLVPGDMHSYATVNPIIRIVPFLPRNVMADLQNVSDIFDVADTVVHN